VDFSSNKSKKIELVAKNNYDGFFYLEKKVTFVSLNLK